jgi:hypothetical protein
LKAICDRGRESSAEDHDGTDRNCHACNRRTAQFAGFTSCEQRYIKRSLDVGLGRQDAFKLWARDAAENASIRSQYVIYQELKALRGKSPARIALTRWKAFWASWCA